MDFENQNQQESGISLADIFRVIRVNWILITAFTLVVTIAVGVYAFTLVPDQYKSTSEVLVQVPVGGGSGEDGGINYLDTQRLIQTASEFVKSDYIINKVKTSGLVTDPDHTEKLNGMSNTLIRRGIAVSSSTTSFIIRISFTSTDEDFSQVMAAALTAVVIDNDVDMFENKFVELTSAGIPENDSPNKILYIIVGAVGGAILGMAFAFMKLLFSNAYMTKEQLEQGTKIQVIGVIPEFDVKERKKA
ncbi:MAG TPA: Wzz/FepE/Etk N-terminal domain-containing protein [Acholeplasma sp.]|nr:Wzz/FepE/Etk N-terminal domain-containing protein [Acholeplasma sp.]